MPTSAPPMSAPIVAQPVRGDAAAATRQIAASQGARRAVLTRLALLALALFSGWGLVALVFSVQGYLFARANGAPRPWSTILVLNLTGWGAWVCVTPVACVYARWARRFKRPWRFAGAHLGGAVLATLLCGFFEGTFKWVVGAQRLPAGFGATLLINLTQYWSFNILVYGMVVGLYYTVTLYREARIRATTAARLETALVQARLDALTAQIQPHFLFNTLHAISALVLEDPKRANQMIARLSVLLRHSFNGPPGTDTTVADELELLDHYVAIQEIRFGDRLRVMFEIDPRAVRARVPALLLQPLVENAIRHATATRASETRVEIVAVREGDRLRLEVRDNGPGLASPAEGAAGMGVANTRARLAQRFGTAFRFELRDAPGSGALALIELPFESSDSAPSPHGGAT
jgi:two-component system LytT family sensor kinase